MSYCRFGKKFDVYAWADGSGGYRTMIAGGQVEFKDRTNRGLLKRLTNLRTAGFKIDPRAFERLEREIGSARSGGSEHGT